MHPFADTFIGKDQYKMSEPVYPLQCYLNRESGEVKLGVDTKADDRYNMYSYSYTSSNSKFSRDHWINYASDVSERLNLKRGSSIVEIGSNDGFLSKQFKDLGYEVLGVDPSAYMVELARDLGIEVVCDLFNLKTSTRIVESTGSVDLVIANNVFNHSNNPEDFVKGVTGLLKPGGMYVYELPYWYNTIKDKKFDQIYHEHVTYFTVKYSYELLRRAGLEIVDVEVVDYHGGSLRVFAKKVDNVSLQPVVRGMIEKEISFGLFDEAMYKEFMQDLYQKRNQFLRNIYKIKSEGYSIIGVGAAAKGNTFLNFYNLDNTVLDYVTDTSEHKQGKYTPLTRIPIIGDEIFADYDRVYALILSWNISDIIKKNLKKINNKIEFLSLPV